MVSSLASCAVIVRVVELVAPADHVPAAGTELMVTKAGIPSSVTVPELLLVPSVIVSDVAAVSRAAPPAFMLKYTVIVKPSVPGGDGGPKIVQPERQFSPLSR
jgi:hypothetical protein